jgi:hypothetical protein
MLESERELIMIGKIVNEIEGVLKRGDFEKGIDLMRDWLSTCQPGEPGQLLQASSPQMRPNVTLLMRDLISRYPNTLLGCPFLVYCTQDASSDLLVPICGMELPFPSRKNAKPCSDLHFIGWLPCDTQLPVRFPFQPAQYETTVNWCTPTAYVALFRAHPDVLDLDGIAVPSEWWADVFIHATRSDQVGNVRIEGDMLLNYPDAIEVAAAMQAGARGNSLSVVGPFRHELSWAYEQGVVFLENCHIQFISSKI